MRRTLGRAEHSGHGRRHLTQPVLPVTTAPAFLPRERLTALLDALARRGYECIGPRVRDGAIVYAALEGPEDLPTGVHVRQEPGTYRIEHSETVRQFAWSNGPQAVKPLAFAPREQMWRAERDASGRLRFREILPEPTPIAVIGIRACDLAALALQDRHFLREPLPDPWYAARRARLFLVAMDCSHPGATCFCASTGDGPQAQQGFDLAMAELDEGFVCRAGSACGEQVLSELALTSASTAQVEAAGQEAAAAAASQTRHLPGRNLQAALFANLDHPRWAEVAARCLSCGNCTSVCPTCFCNAEHDAPELSGAASTHLREWDSCFTKGHSHLHGHTVRPDTHTRYRQWLTHKLGSWHSQFGRSGCVGCGRCIAWCPTGIDLTEEAAAICGTLP